MQSIPGAIEACLRVVRRVVRAVVVVVFAAIVVVVADRLAKYGDVIAVRTNLGGLLVGTIFLAAATSLPEFITAISAFRAGAPDLAAGVADHLPPNRHDRRPAERQQAIVKVRGRRLLPLLEEPVFAQAKDEESTRGGEQTPRLYGRQCRLAAGAFG